MLLVMGIAPRITEFDKAAQESMLGLRLRHDGTYMRIHVAPARISSKACQYQDLHSGTP
jgi:hypothetical protein